MKTAMSLPDDLFHQAEHLADRLGVSRSELYRLAVSHYLKLHDDDQITQTLNDVCSEGKQNAENQQFSRAAARRLGEQERW